MKKPMFVCYFIFTMSVFHLLIPNIMFGEQSIAQQVFDRYKSNLFQQAEIRKLLPGVLDIFIDTPIQKDLSPIAMGLILRNPPLLKSFDPEISPRFLELLTTDSGLRKLFGDEQFYQVLKNTHEIKQLKTELNEPVPDKLEKSRGDNQDAASNETLKPFVVVVKDQNEKRLNGVSVIFEITSDEGTLSEDEGTLSDKRKITVKIVNMGEAEATLTLGDKLGIYQVKASVVGFPLLTQTFTAAAVTTTFTLEIVSGDLQEGVPQTALGNPLVVLVRDQHGDALSGVDVTFRVPRGGSLSRPTARTNSNGRAETILTLGSDPGIYQVKASAVRITQTQTFTAIAIDPGGGGGGSQEPPMYWIGDNRIHYRLPGGREETFEPPKDEATLTGGLAVDTIGRKVYWTEEKSDGMGRVRSADLDGNKVQTVKDIIAVPSDIAFDPWKKKLYWTNDQANPRNDSGRIHSINVNDATFNARFITDLNAPKHIAFDVEGRRLYWTDAGGIWSTFPESAGRQNILFLKNLDEVRDIAVFSGVVYWTEQTLVRYRNGTGSGDKKLLPTPEGSSPEGIAVDPGGKRVYWTTSDGEIRSAPLTNPTQFVVERSVGPATGIALGGTAASGTPMMAPSISPAVSAENTLLANYPNPFNPETWIPYKLSVSADVSVSIYSVNGHLVRRLDLGHQSAGVYRSRSRAAYWDGRNEFGERVASGLYFYTLTAGDFTATRKMLIRK